MISINGKLQISVVDGRVLSVTGSIGSWLNNISDDVFQDSRKVDSSTRASAANYNARAEKILNTRHAEGEASRRAYGRSSSLSALGGSSILGHCLGTR